LSLRVRHSVPKPYKADRTVLRFELPDSAFAVAIEDLLANDCVWVARAGVFVSREPAPVQLGEYLRRISDRKTVLQQVRERPEQTLEKAMAAVHNPVQDLGPVMLSLSCDNRKFIVERDGTVVFDLYSGRGDPAKAAPDQCRMTPRFGGGPGAPVARRMLDGWPIIAIDTVAGGVSCRQSTCVTGKGVCVAAFELERPRSSPGDALAPLAIGFSLGRRRLAVRPVGDRLLCIADGDRLVAAVRSIGDGLALEAEEGGVSLAGRLPPGGTCLVLVAIPAYHLDVKDGNCLESISLTRSRTDTHDYWRQILEPAMDVRLPDRLLSDVVRLSQIHCMMAARSEEGSQRIAPWISADRYGPLESEANSILRGLGMWGHDEFARRGFDYFVHRYNRAGYLTTGYTIVGTGWHLWTLAEHYERTQDRAWLQSIAPEVARVCRWVVRQRTKTQRLGPRGEKAPEHGLMPPGVTADWNRYSYRFFNDAQYCAGLEAAVGMLASIGHPDAPALRADAEAYRRDIVRAYRHAQARSPVVRIGNGTWAPYAPSILDCFGNVEEFFPAEDWNRSWAGSVEIGAHHLAATGVLDPEGPETDWMLDYLEDHQFLRSGMGDYPEERNRKDPFNLGGFAKVQPYYGRTAEIYARRDDVRAFLRAYFNAIPSLLSRENLSFWEHFHNTGGWNKTHETGWFLCQSRLMLVQERGEQLWLAPMVPAAWFRDGGEIAVKNAPTRFGRAGYRICSSAAGGVIEATVDPPSRKPPKEIVLRLRHPEGKPIRAAAVQGKPHRDFDARKECVRFAPEGRPITIRAEF
jgi:hypothetical protein